MNKENQSLLDFLQSLAPSALHIRQSVLSNKEAQTLFDIWRHGNQDEYGKFVIPENTDSLQVASLTTKGYVRNVPSNYAARHPVQRTLEFTKKGQEVIRNIILHQEKSSFEKKSNSLDYDAILQLDQMPTIGKTANKQKLGNWLQRISNGTNFKKSETQSKTSRYT